MKGFQKVWAWYLRQPRYIQVIIALALLWIALTLGGVESVPIPDVPFVPDR